MRMQGVEAMEVQTAKEPDQETPDREAGDKACVLLQ